MPIAVQRPAPAGARGRLTVDDYVTGVIGGDRAMLGRTITMVESRNPRHQEIAQEIITRLLPHAGKSYRIGITGVPGVGKSTFIESFGCMLTGKGHRVAVLAVDPTSPVSGGSILGDKTRMQTLSQEPNAFIRPSPSGGTLGGVTRTTRQTIVVVEAAGYDVVLIETVGTGQSEVAVSAMSDFFLVLMLPGAGDELQGIKKGVLEIADMIVVNKADGDNEIRAKQAMNHYRNALHILQPRSPNWAPPVQLCSSLNGKGLDSIWTKLLEYKEKLTNSGEFQEKRQEQRIQWMWTMLQDRLMTELRTSPAVIASLPAIEQQLRAGQMIVSRAVDKIMAAYHSGG